MKEDTKKIIEASINAPSGSNSQPWRFEVENNTINLFILPEKDHPILNYRNRGTLIAGGAMVENILISSAEFGYVATVEMFPDKSNQDFIAKIKLENFQVGKNPLFSSIALRSTNRKPFKKDLLDVEKIVELLSVVNEWRDKVKVMDGEENLKQLGEALSKNEIVMLENKTLHKLFFDEIVWTDKDQEQKKSGLYLKTMELKPPQQKALKLFKYWPVINLFNKLGLAKSIAKENSGSYASASLMGAILVDDKDEDFAKAGRIMERLWLKATQMGLGFHILTGIPFLWQRISAGQTEGFSDKHINLVKDAYQKIKLIYKINENKIPTMIFRVGYGDQPSAKSSKKPPEIVFRD